MTTHTKHHSTEFKEIEKVVINVGVGKMRSNAQFDEKVLPEIVKEIASIAGQKPSPRAAKQAIAGFKTRVGDIVGLTVTLRHNRMRDFLKKMISIVLPRVKDFRGLDPKNVDQQGNLNVGFREQVVFPEVDIEKSKVHFGLQVTVVPAKKNRDKAIAFYTSIGVPLRRSESK